MPYKLRKHKKRLKNTQIQPIVIKKTSKNAKKMEPEKEKPSSEANPLTKPCAAENSDSLASIHDRLDSMVTAMTTQFDSLRGDLNSSIKTETKAIQDSLDSFKLEIQRKFDSFKDGITTDMKDLESQVDKNTNALDTQRSKMVIANSEILQLQLDINDEEQRSRNYSIKVSGFKVTSGDVDRAVFNDLILPVIDRAYQLKNPKPALPSFHETVDVAHVLPSKPERIPNIQFRFKARNIRETFLTHKKSFLIEYNRDNHSNVEAKKDYTEINKRCMSTLHEHESVEHYWMSGVQVRFVYKNDPVMRKVLNPLEEDPENMIIPP